MKPFPWRPGMLTTSGERVLVVNGERLTFAGFGAPAKDYEPDQQDPATLGALLDVVERAWAHEGQIVVSRLLDGRGQWRVFLLSPYQRQSHGWMAVERFDALLAAYEAAP